jgi:hypothetical protein
MRPDAAALIKVAALVAGRFDSGMSAHVQRGAGICKPICSMNNIEIPKGVDFNILADKLWQVLYAHDELITPEERAFVLEVFELANPEN